MDKLQIVDSGVARLTKKKKAKLLHMDIMIRSNNQDRYVCDVDNGIFAVADGVGGGDYGEVAATEACEAFHAERLAKDRAVVTDEMSLLIAQTSLLRIIHTAAQATAGLTTFTGAYLTRDNQLAYLHAGDSSLVRRRDGVIYHATGLHNLPGHSNRILNFVGGEHEVGPHRMAPRVGGHDMALTEWGFIDLQADDQIILVTDGVTSLLDGSELTDFEWNQCMRTKRTKQALGAQAVADKLVRISDRPDDATAVVLQFGVVS